MLDKTARIGGRRAGGAGMSNAGRSGQPWHILLVEDEPGLQEVLASVLVAEGYEVTVAHDGLEGLARLAARRPDLIITAYMMPHLSGIEMIRQIRADPDHAGIPILLLTAALIADEHPLADAFLRKPISIDQLLTVIAQLLEPA